MMNHTIHPQDLSWTEEDCKELISVAEAIKRLNANDDFQLFKQQYIEKQRKDWERNLVSSTLGSRERQEAIERLIGIGNLETYLESRDSIAEQAKRYLESLRRSKKKVNN